MPYGAPPGPAYPMPGYPGMPHPPKKSRTGLIVLAIAGVLLLGVAGLSALYLIGRTAETQPTTAATVSDLDAVCKGGSITNAGAFTAPYRIAAFVKHGDDIGQEGFVFSSTSWDGLNAGGVYEAGPSGHGEQTSESDPGKVNAVACLTEIKQERSKKQTCSFQNSRADYYSTRYRVTLHEAKSGRKVRDLGEVSGSADTCPFMVTVRRGGVVANPDAEPLKALLVGFTG